MKEVIKKPSFYNEARIRKTPHRPAGWRTMRGRKGVRGMAKKKRNKKEREGRTFYRSVAAGTVPMDREMVRMNWGWGLAMGIIMILLGIFAVLYPIFTSASIVFLLGVVLVVAGIVQIVHAFSWQGWGKTVWHALVGLVYGVVGLFLMFYPLAGLVTLAVLLAIYFIVSGLLRIILSISARHTQSWGWMLFSGIVSVILGIIVIVGFPVLTMVLVGLLIGIDLVVNGFALTYRSIAAHA